MSKTIKDFYSIFDSLHSTPNYVQKGFAMVRAADNINDFLDLSKCVLVSEEDMNKHNKNYTPQKGDLIITRVGVNLGKMSYVDTNNRFCLGQNIAIISNKKGNTKFLYYYLLSPSMQAEMKRIISGSAYKCLGLDKIRNLPYNCENLQTTQIGDFLYSIDLKININRKINKELERLAKTIFDYWFLQYEFPNEKGKPYKSSGGKMIWNDELKKEIPEGWKVSKIGKIIIEKEKSMIQVGEAKERSGEYPFFTNGNEILETNEFLTDGRNCYLSTGGKGKIQYYVGKSSYSTDTWVITGRNSLEDYLYLFIKSIENVLDKKYFAGTGLKHLQKELFKDTNIVIPNDEILKKFNALSNSMFDKISQTYKENKELQQLRNFLLPLMMNGQVGFKD